MLTLLHSCGYIMDILEDLIEIGLDVIQIDQQENMGLGPGREVWRTHNLLCTEWISKRLWHMEVKMISKGMYVTCSVIYGGPKGDSFPNGTLIQSEQGIPRRP